MSNTFSVFRNTGSAGVISFAPKVNFPTIATPSNIAIGDLDGDGKSDVVVANVSGTSAFRNTGTSGTISFAAKVDFYPGTFYGASIGDADGDGKPDIAIADNNSARVSLLRNSSSTGHVAFDPNVDFASGIGPGIVICDFDGDGKADLAVANENANRVDVLRNTVFPAITANASALSVCQGTMVTLTGGGADTYIWSGSVTNGVGFVPSTTATYSVTGTISGSGCSNTAAISITVKTKSASFLTQTACENYLLNAQTYTASGTYTQMLSNTQGCDSVVTLNLTINKNSSSALSVNACASYLLNAQTYSASGTYTQILPNAHGCDSIITLNLTINKNTSSTLFANACVSYLLNAQTYTASGTYTQQLINSKGCDSILTLNLIVSPRPVISAGMDVTVCKGQTAMLCASGGLQYNWLPAGQAGQCVLVAPLVKSSYTVVGTDANSCTNSSVVKVAVDPCLGLMDLQDAAFSADVYPNPSGGIFNVRSEAEISAIELVDVYGESVYHTLLNTGNSQIDVSQYSKGLYILKLTSAGRTLSRKIVIQ